MEAMIAICGAKRWAEAMIASRPIAAEEDLIAEADRTWSTMDEPDWLEAFACHPRIGQRKTAPTQSGAWSQQEQAAVGSAESEVLAHLAEGNQEYENRFGFTYIVCATGKSAPQMLEILNSRLRSNRADELREAAEQQRQIMHIRLRKWLNS